MTPPVATSDASLPDLRAQTLRRLAALAWLADIAWGILVLLRHRLASPAWAVRDGARLRPIAERVRRAARLIAALEARLRETLRLIEAGVRPSPAQALERAPLETPSHTPPETETVEPRERGDCRERPERLLATASAPPRLVGSLDEIVARIIEDLGAFPAWRRLAEAVWSGDEPTPTEVARVLAGGLNEALNRTAPSRPASTAKRAPPRRKDALHWLSDHAASGPPRDLPAPA